MKHWIILPLLFFFHNLSAQDDHLTFKILKQLNLSLKQCEFDLVTSKKLPHKPEETIYVIPEIAHEEPNLLELNSHILIVDSQTGKIKYRFYESATTNDWISDAIQLNNISIDTAPYYVNKGVRAFGIRVKYSGSSRPNPYSHQSLSLFVKEGKQLKQVLKNYTTADYSGEWDMICESEFANQKKILIITSNKTNGYYNIKVKNTVTYSNSAEDLNGNCIEEKKSTIQKTILIFDSKKYKEYQIQ